jgi:glycosyltransferase involved in cell wall biosynthesis
VKVLYLITGLRLGGAEHQLLILAKNMRKKGNDVEVVSMESGGVMKAQFHDEGIVVHELAIKKVGSLRSGYSAFKKIVIDFNPDVIHSHMIHANLFGRVFKLFNSKYRLINTAHNIKEGGFAMMKAYALTKSLPEWSTNVSKEAYDHFLSKGYFASERSSYLPNAIDTDKFKPDDDNLGLLHAELKLDAKAFIYLSAGRLEHQKNYPMLLRAFTLVRREVGNGYLVIAGEGQEEAMLKKLSVDLKINAFVRFLGRRNDMSALLNNCCCFVLSSDYEGFGMVVAEAMAVGKSVVATDSGGVKEVMGGFGELVHVNDTEALALAMIRTYRFPALPATSEAARNHVVVNYSIPGVISSWLKLYNEI